MQHTLAKHSYAVLLIPLIVVCIWSLNVSINRYAIAYISPMSMSFYRWLIAWLILTPFILPTLMRHQQQLRAYFPQLAVLSLFGMMLSQCLAYFAALHTTATNMGIINACLPILTLCIASWLLREKISRIRWCGSLLSFIGLMYIVTQTQQIGHSPNEQALYGNLFMLAAICSYALYCVLLKKWDIQLPLMVSLYSQISLATLYHLPLLGLFGLDAWTRDNAASLLYAGIFTSLIAPLLWMTSIRLLGPSSTSNFMYLTPIITAVIASVWLLEQWTMAHSVGSLMIISGIILSQKMSSTANPE